MYILKILKYVSCHLPGYELLNVVRIYGHHRHGFVCTQPEGPVVTTGVVAHIVWITEKERHRRKLPNARSSET